MGIINRIGKTFILQKSDLAYLFQHQAMHLQGLFRGINEFIIDEGEPLSIELIEENIDGYNELHATLMSKKIDAEFSDILKQKIDPMWRDVKNGAISGLNLTAKSSTKETQKIFSQWISRLLRRLSARCVNFSTTT